MSWARASDRTQYSLDPVEPELLYEPFWKIYRCLDEKGHLDMYQGAGGTLLVSLDGPQFFSSQEIHCSNCRVSVRDEKTYYSHLMMAVVCAPEQEHVICLEPEFITPQDGHEKQVCEQQAKEKQITWSETGPEGPAFTGFKYYPNDVEKGDVRVAGDRVRCAFQQAYEAHLSCPEGFWAVHCGYSQGAGSGGEVLGSWRTVIAVTTGFGHTCSTSTITWTLCASVSL